MRHEVESLRPPIFLEHSLSGGDNGRDRLFQAQSGLSWLGEKPEWLNESTGKLPVSRSCVVKSLNNTPPFSGEVICCLAGILAESRGSRHGSGLDAEAKLAVLSSCQERFLGQCRDGVPDSRTGVILGEFARILVLSFMSSSPSNFFQGANLGRVVGGLFGFTGNPLES